MADTIPIVPRESLPDTPQHLEAFFLGLPRVESRGDVPRVLREEIGERLYVLWYLYETGRMREKSQEIHEAFEELISLSTALAYLLESGVMPTSRPMTPIRSRSSWAYLRNSQGMTTAA